MPPRLTPALTFLDRHGPDGALRIPTIGMGVFAGTITTGLCFAAALGPPVTPHALLRAIAAGLLTGTAMHLAARAVSEGAGAALLAFVLPAGTAAEPAYSRLEALAARGNVAAALAGFERVIAANPGASVARLQAAELYVRAGDARRAEALLHEVLRHPARTDAYDLRAANRLVDLYLGPLGEPRSALRELRRIADAHAGTPVGDGAREAIARLERETVTSG